MAPSPHSSKEGTPSSSKSLPDLVCIEFPGVGENIDKMIHSLGGMKKISEVYCEENRRMELRYRPDDLFCKPVCGERHISTSILIKVIHRRKVRKKGSAKKEDESKGTFKVEPIGVVGTTFKFDSMCDFQYLPMTMSADGLNMRCLYKDLLPQGMASSDWLEGPAPLFLPPATFSRMDTPQDYRFKTESTSEKMKTPQNVICRTRQRRTHFAIFHSFKDKGVPQKPLPGAVSQIRFKFLDSEFFQKVKDEFAKRPIWSKNALRARLKFSKDKLKYLLPTVSYYFHTGPWRNLWVKFGYDPRSNPNAWLYQTFDFRIRQAGGAKTKVEAKRNYSNYILPYKSVHNCKKKTSLVSSIHLGEDSTEGEDKREGFKRKKADGVSEEFYLFRPGMIPPYRQMFYQYCDVHVPEIQKLLESSILNDANKTCSEKNGWLPAGVETKCRDILSNLIERTLLEKSEGENLPEEEDFMSNSDADDAEEDLILEGNSTEDET